jgi:hypothetical protein
MACYQINGGTTSGIFDHVYCARNFYITPDHSAGWTLEESATSSYTIKNSVFTDIESTAWIVVLYGGDVDGMYVYGNIFSYSPNNKYNRNGVGNAVYDCINSNAVCNNVYFYNNTIANVTGSQVNNQSGQLGYIDTRGTNWTFENNLIYNSKSNGVGGATTPSNLIQGYNTYINLTNGGKDGGTNSFQLTGAADPFVNDGAFNYSLLSETVLPHLNDGLNLAAPYNVDMTGTVRGADGTWERGALQYRQTSGPPSPPTNLSVLVN